MNDTQRRWTLRERTAEAHAMVDASVGTFRDADGYKRYLLASYQFRVPLERSLDDVAWPSAFGAWRPRCIGRELRDDLADFGLTPPEPAVLPPPSGSELLGVLYVLEGSALGARLLQQRAAELGFDAGFGARHLVAHGNVDSWRAFLERLEAAAPFDIDTAAAASLNTFRAAAAAYQGS